MIYSNKTNSYFDKFICGVVFLAGALGLLPQTAKAQNFPSRPVRLIIPFSAGGAADVEPEALRRPRQQTLGSVENVQVGGRFGRPVGMGIDAIIAAFPVERGPGARQVAEERLGKRREVASARDVGELILDPGSGIGEEHRNAVDDRVFPLAHSLRAKKSAFQNVFALLTGNMRQPQQRNSLAVDPAQRTDRLNAFAVFETQWELAADNDVGRAGGDNLARRTGNRRDTPCPRH